jgi:hypothetical protein
MLVGPSAASALTTYTVKKTTSQPIRGAKTSMVINEMIQRLRHREEILG